VPAHILCYVYYILRNALYTAYARAGYILRSDVHAGYMRRGICYVQCRLFPALVIFSNRGDQLDVKNRHAHHGTRHP